VAGRDGNQQGIVPDRLGDDAFSHISRVRKSGCEVAGKLAANLPCQGNFGQTHLDFGLFLSATSQKSRQPAIDRTVGNRDSQTRLQVRRDSPGVLLRMLQNGKQPADILQKSRTGWCQLSSTTITIKKGNAQIIFQLLDCSRQRRLLDMQTFGCAGEM